jgi:CRISPR/Cas system CMR-associated protein Cmr5 small subunit
LSRTPIEGRPSRGEGYPLPIQRARRRDNLNPLYDPSATLSGRALKRTAEAMTRTQVTPQRRALEAQRRDVTGQDKALVTRADSYYRTMADQQANAIATQKALQERVGQQVQAASDQSKAAIDQASTEASGAVAKAQALTGVDAGVNQRVATEAQAAKSNQALQAGQSAATAAGAAGNYQGLQGTLSQARQLQGGEVRGALLKRAQSDRSKITQQIADLKAQTGDLNLKNVTALRQAGFENKVTVAGLGLKQADLQSKAQQAAANRKLAKQKAAQVERQNKRQARLTRRGQDVTAGNSRRSTATTRVARTFPTLIGRRRRGTRASRRAQGNGVVAQLEEQDRQRQVLDRQLSRPGTHRAADHQAGTQGRYPPVVLNAARDLEYLGYLSGPNIAALRRAGVRIPREWLRKPKRSKSAGALTGRGN